MRVFILFLQFLVVSYTFAQDYYEEPLNINADFPPLENNEKAESPFFKHAFTIPFTSILDLSSPSINVGFEKSMSKKFGLYFMLGYTNDYINYLTHLIFLNRDPYHGFKLGIEPRFYLARNVKTNIFLTPSVSYKLRFQSYKNTFVSRHGGNYFEALDFHRLTHTTSFIPKFGLQFLKPDKVIGFELTAGVGLFFRKIHYKGLPEDAVYTDNNDFVLINDETALLILPIPQVTFGILIASKQRRY